MIIARYGQLGLNLSPVTSIYAIAKSFKIPKTSVLNVLESYHNHDGVVVIPKQGRKFQNIPENIERQLLNPERLHHWGPYSLKQRAVLCQRELNYRVSYYRLRKVYMEANVRYRKTKWVYRQSIELKEPLERQRQEFALVLAGVIKEGRGPIYFDEST